MSPTTPKLFGPDRHYERWRWQIFAITWLAYAGFYLTRKSFALAKTAEGFALTTHEQSWVDGGFLTAYAIGMFVAGVCGDRFGTRKVIVIGMIGCVLSAIGMGLCQNAPSMTAWSVLHGLFQSAGWAPLSKNVTNFFSRHERGVVMGFWCTNYAAGGAIANIYAGWIGDSLGWRAAFFIPALTLLGVLALFTVAQRNRPEDVGLPPIEVYHQDSDTADALPPSAAAAAAPSSDTKAGAWKTAIDVLSNPMVLLLSLIYFCLKPARYAILTSGPKYVSETLGSRMAESGTISAMFELAGPLSVILAGFISDRVFGSRRMPVSVICLFLLGGLLLVLDRIPHSRLMLGSGLFLMGILTFAPDSLVSGTAAVDFGTKRGASTASGLINGAGSLGGIVGGTIPGLRDQWGWQGVFNFLAVAVIVAALLLLPKWNALPQQRKH